MTSSILASLQLQPAALVLGMAQAVVLVGCRVEQQRYILRCRFCHIKALQNKIEQHLLTQSCQNSPSRRCFSIDDLQPAAFKHKCWVDVNENLKTLTTSGLAKPQELLAQMLQIGSAICQVLNRLLCCVIQPAGTLTATLNTQIPRKNSYRQLSQKQKVLWEATISQSAQTLLEDGTIAFLNQPKVIPAPKNHPKDTLRLLVRYRKLNRGTRRNRTLCCGKQIFSKKQIGESVGWSRRGSTPYFPTH